MKFKDHTQEIAIGFVMIGLVSIYIGEVFPAVGEYVVPAGAILLRAFLIIIGIELRARGYTNAANLWLAISVTLSAALIGFMYKDDLYVYMHVALQATNIFLIGVELSAGMLQERHPDSIEVERLSERAASLDKELREARKEAQAAKARAAEFSNQSTGQLETIASQREEIATLNETLATEKTAAAKVGKQLARLQEAGILNGKFNARYVSFNASDWAQGVPFTQCIITADNEASLRKRTGLNGQMKLLAQ